MSIKMTLTQAMIEAVISRSKLFKDLKKQNDVNVECIGSLSVAVSELTEAVGTLNNVVKQYESMFESLFSDQGYNEEVAAFNLSPFPDKTDKKLN